MNTFKIDQLNKHRSSKYIEPTINNPPPSELVIPTTNRVKAPKEPLIKPIILKPFNVRSAELLISIFFSSFPHFF